LALCVLLCPNIRAGPMTGLVVTAISMAGNMVCEVLELMN